MRNKLYYVIVLLWLIGCNGQEDFIKQEQLPVIDLNQINAEGIDLNEVANDITYIPLENRNYDFMGVIYNIFKTNDRIFIRDRQNAIFIYNLEGDLLNKINKVGNAPQEYAHISDFTVDDQNELFYIYDDATKKIFMYDFQGNFQASRKLDAKALNLTYLDQSTIISYVPPGYYPENINSAALAMIPVPQGNVDFVSTEFESGISKRSPFILSCLLTRSYDQEVLFKERFNDTVYVVQKDTSLIPRLVFDGGERDEQPEDYASVDQFDAVNGIKIQIWGLHFTRDYDCISFQEVNRLKVLLYNKRTGEKMLSLGKGGIRQAEEGEDVYFFPRAIGVDNELVGFYYPQELKQAQLKAGGRLSEISAQLNNSSNPVIAVVNLK